MQHRASKKAQLPEFCILLESWVFGGHKSARFCERNTTVAHVRQHGNVNKPAHYVNEPNNMLPTQGLFRLLEFFSAEGSMQPRQPQRQTVHCCLLLP